MMQQYIAVNMIIHSLETEKCYILHFYSFIDFFTGRQSVRYSHLSRQKFRLHMFGLNENACLEYELRKINQVKLTINYQK